jgi:hypothetical protein
MEKSLILIVSVLCLSEMIHCAIDPKDFAYIDALMTQKSKPSGKWRMAARDENLRWRNATIPYQIAPMAFSLEEIKGLKESMDIYMEETCLTFRPVEETDPYSIIIRDGGWGCNAILGQAGTKGAQTVNLANGCRYYGLFLHELGHTIGLHHEHQHPDRDRGVRVNMENVDPTMRQWFELIDRKELNMYGVDYDIQSIMHYEETAFAANDENGNKKITIVAHNPAQQRFLYHVYMKDLSFGDVKRINLMYKCSSHCKTVNCPNGFVNKHCQCETPQTFARRRCFNKYSDEECQNRKEDCSSKNEYDLYEMFVNCRKTCNRCYQAV